MIAYSPKQDPEFFVAVFIQPLFRPLPGFAKERVVVIGRTAR